MNKHEHKGQVILITGGGSGLGFAMAQAFTKTGASVVITGRDQAKLDEACSKLGAAAHAYVNDVTALDSTPSLVTQIERDIGPIHCLVNNAGAHLKSLPEDVNDEDLQRVINTNLTGVFVMSRECARPMATRGSGSILMISSMAAMVGIPRVAVYSITKSGLLGATMSLATDLGPRGIRVNAICPGFIDTPMFRKATDGDPERKARILGRTPLGEFGMPEDIADTALFLASDKARFITGAVLPVDGGFSIGF